MLEIEGKKLSREYLFKLVASNFHLIDDFLANKQNRQFIINVFEDSGKIAEIVESYINENDNYISFNDFRGKIINSVQEDSFREYLNNYLYSKFHEKYYKMSKESYNSIIIAILKEIAIYHNKMIEKNFMKPWYKYDEKYEKDVPQTFLSYAYYDKGVSLGLFIYFQINGGFLYVNWMWSGVNSNALITKDQLDKELKNSNQFLFLRTINSELDYYGNSHIRQWCSWEIGNYYTKNKDEKYYLNFYGKDTKNDLLSNFSVFRYVKNGVING